MSELLGDAEGLWNATAHGGEWALGEGAHLAQAGSELGQSAWNSTAAGWGTASSWVSDEWSQLDPQAATYTAWGGGAALALAILACVALQLRRSWTARLLLRLASSGSFLADGLGGLAQGFLDELLVAPRLAVDPYPQMDRRRGGGGGGGGAYRGPLAGARAVHWLCLELGRSHQWLTTLRFRVPSC